MSIESSASNLLQAFKDLRREWEETREYWRDAKREEFDRKFLEHLPADIGRAGTAMKELDTILKRIRENCE